MADQLKLNLTVTYIQGSPPQTFQLMSVETIITDPTSFEHGKFQLAASAPQQSLCPAVSDITELVLKSDQPITVTVGTSGSGKDLLGITFLVYKGNPTEVHIANPGVNPANIQYVMAAE